MPQHYFKGEEVLRADLQLHQVSGVGVSASSFQAECCMPPSAMGLLEEGS